MKRLALLPSLALLFCSCTTLPNRNDPYSRRDLYNPDYAQPSRRAPTPAPPTPEPKPQFR